MKAGGSSPRGLVEREVAPVWSGQGELWAAFRPGRGDFFQPMARRVGRGRALSTGAEPTGSAFWN
jgi:hypothetical protein